MMSVLVNRAQSVQSESFNVINYLEQASSNDRMCRTVMNYSLNGTDFRDRFSMVNIIIDKDNEKIVFLSH